MGRYLTSDRNAWLPGVVCLGVLSVLLLRVPQDWRTGMIEVGCGAVGAAFMVAWQRTWPKMARTIAQFIVIAAIFLSYAGLLIPGM